MKKRIFAGLLTLVMVFTLLPVSALAEARDWEQNLFNDFQSAYGTLVGTKSFTAATTFQTDKDGQLKVMPILEVPSGYTTITYNAMAYCGAKAASSNTDVVEVKQTDDGKQDICIGKWEGGDFHGADCLQVNVTPKKAGSAVVTISFYYTFSQSVNPFQNGRNTRWFKGTMQYTVKVTEPEPDPEVEYTLNYDANGGENAPTSQTAKSSTGSATFTISGTTPTLKGYDFQGWSTTKGGAVQYQPDGSITVTATETTLYAVWEKKVPEVTPPDAFLKNAITVLVKHVDDGAAHIANVGRYPLSGNSSADYEVGAVTTENGVTTCTVTIKNAQLYLDKYDKSVKAGTHRLADGETAEKTIKLTWDAAANQWTFTPAEYQVTCQEKKQIEYELTYDANAGEDEVKNVPAKDSYVDTKSYHVFNIPTMVPEREGYIFKGWASSAEASVAMFQPGKTITVQSGEPSKTLYAIWEKKQIEYELTYDANAGEDEVKNVPAKDSYVDTKSYHVFNIPTMVPEREGYIFKGWASSAEASVAMFQPGKTITVQSGEPSKTLYAVWEKKQIEYELTYDANAGEDEVKNVPAKDSYVDTKSYHVFNIPTMVPEREGYIFKGWASSAEASVAMFQPGKTITVQSGEPSKTLYAVWEKKQIEYELTYDANAGEDEVKNVPAKDSYVDTKSYHVFNIPTMVPEREGYIFKGWASSAEASVAMFQPGKTITVQSGEPSKTLYALWELNSYTVTFNADNGTEAAITTVKHGQTVAEPTAPTKAGYNFDGWFLNGVEFDFTTAIESDITLTAQWTKRSSGGSGSSSRDYDYTLRYVTNGGKAIASETKSKSWTKDYEDLPMPTRAGYRFDGWYYDSALKKEVTDDVKVNSRTVTLYAGWTGSSVPDSLNGEDHFAYVQGYADGTVRPNTPVTRAQVATILFRLLDESVRKEYLTESNTFTDVAANYWANTAISTMANMGVFKGRTADRFDPNAPITRGEFAAVCARFDDSKVKTTETYSDIDGYWAADEILRAAALGWVQGYQDGSYRPNNSITRAQVVTMINRVLCRMPEENADLLKGMTSFTDCAEGDWCYLAIQEATNSHDYKTKSGSIHEKWTDLNTAPDWSKFEH